MHAFSLLIMLFRRSLTRKSIMFGALAKRLTITAGVVKVGNMWRSAQTLQF